MRCGPAWGLRESISKYKTFHPQATSEILVPNIAVSWPKPFICLLSRSEGDLNSASQTAAMSRLQTLNGNCKTKADRLTNTKTFQLLWWIMKNKDEVYTARHGFKLGFLALLPFFPKLRCSTIPLLQTKRTNRSLANSPVSSTEPKAT